MNVSFLGLGVMGYPMAGHLARAGHKVTVYNRSGAKAEKWANEFGGALAATPKEAAIGQEIVFACVGNDDDLRSITLGEAGAFAGMSGARYSLTTRPPALTLLVSYAVQQKHSMWASWMRRSRADNRAQRTVP